MADEPILSGHPEGFLEQAQTAPILDADLTELAPPTDLPTDLPIEQTGQSIGQDPNALTEEEKKALMDLVDNWERQDEEWRYSKLRDWKLAEHFWNDNQHNVWSEFAQDWRPIENYVDLESDDLDLEGFEPRTVNIYKAHGEIVIAALAAGVPGTRFYPDDADSNDDVSTAKVWSRAAELIQRRNKATFLLIKALYILWNQGVVAAYNYSRTDPKLGTILQPIRGMVPQTQTNAYCPQCGNAMQGSPACENCGYEGQPEVENTQEDVPGVIGHRSVPRITEAIEVYSPLYFKVPRWISSQEQAPYLTLDSEHSAGSIIGAFEQDDPDIREKCKPTKDTEKFERWARENVDRSGYENDLVTIRQRWVRSWGLQEIEDEAIRLSLMRKFPDGVYFVQAGDEFIVGRNESIDDHWSISVSPTSTHIHAQAQGKGLINLNEIENELTTMTMDNIEHGTSMMFADSELINIKKFKQSRTAPGSVYPVKVPPGQQIGHYIHETRPATLSDEVRHFRDSNREKAQFISGAYPSIYGGAIEGGSNTAAEYNQSRVQALQRLQITWKIVSEWWSELMKRSVADYLNNLTYDERFVKPHGKMGYINVWIRKSEMTGRVGDVMAETSEQLPITYAQKRDILISLMNMKEPNINAALFHPENSALVAQTIGFPEFYIPGDDDRSKQLNEIMILLTAMPIPQLDPMNPMGPPAMMPTVMPNLEVDDHAIHMSTIKAFLVSDVGQQMQIENPGGFENCLAHYRAHEQMQMMTAIKEMQKTASMGMMNPATDVPENTESEPRVEVPASE
jgi:hypothetical protein